jgi:sucrose synthase
MIDTLACELQEHRKLIYLLLRRYADLDRALLLRSDIIDVFEEFCAEPLGRELEGTPFAAMLRTAQEAVVRPPTLCFALRPRVANWRYVTIQMEDVLCREMDVCEFLETKERLVDGVMASDTDWALEVDFEPFERGFPRLRESRSIGRGVEFLNRHLSSRMFQGSGRGAELLFEFLKVHEVRGQQLMLNGEIANLAGLVDALRHARELLEPGDPEQTWAELERPLRRLGFEPGWGRSSAQILDTMTLLSDILEAPSPDILERFLRRIPMIFSIAVISPHGYFGQAGVLGKPDTGGQIVYILDQVRALEREMRRSIHDQGLEVEPQIVVLTRLIPDAERTSCDQPHEPILGTENCRILRVPFRDEAGEILPHWISRFHIWPHLERFARDGEQALVAEMQERPDLVIGNYSDGNLVASLIAKSLGVTQCNIAHALEKTKYLHSDLYWQQHDNEHHFACQFTAYLIAMNRADFIITSTYQEIAGTRDAIGQYESYRAFTLPSLYRVVAGIDPFDPKFNIVSPGADEETFFPWWERERRLDALHGEIEQLALGPEAGREGKGELAEPDKPLLFAMSRLDHIKNVAGLVDWYGRNHELRERANLLIIAGDLDEEMSADAEERHQIERMHALFDEHSLHSCVRWIPKCTDKALVGEIYRWVADRRGAFVQPALFEAFGLTVIEAMASGLPTFATCYGGPLEIIEDGRSGFHIDPNHGDEATRRMEEFLGRTASEPAAWEDVSRASWQRVQDRYTWKLYANRLLALSRIYGFWKFISNIEREETARYLDMFYGLMYRRLATRIR